MAKADIMGDPKFQQFVRSRGHKERTIRIHCISLQFYSEFLGKTPTEIIDEAIMEEEDRIRRDSRKIQTYFLNFIEYLQGIGNSPQTIKNKINSVKTFYHQYEVETPKVRISKCNENRTLVSIPEKEHIRQVLPHASIRNKAIILLMSSSGMGSAETRNLTYNHFLNAIKEEIADLTDEEKMDINKVKSRIKNKDIIGEWKVVRQKTGMPYFTFSTPESIHAIINYLIDNERQNKPIKSKDEYLFAVNGKRMQENTLHQAFKTLNDKCGFGKQGYQRFFRSHAMRKFMATSLFVAGMDRAKVKMMLGHVEGDTNEAYFKFPVKDMKNIYLKYMDAVTIQDTKTRTIDSEDYHYLASMIREKDDALANVEKRLEEIEANKKEKRKSIDELFSNLEFVEDFRLMAEKIM
ncbi:site-specific integrase [Methanobacterium formicicum]|uniref:Integrase family protein n=1 Tax=Methanobacterium formicicum (strain DSM 3637 / PP1) TaxID=1204725 RepID=K2QFT2_METFP|nr:site-specific integrase [Methanobacterium formicicum]EKF86931.1 integrase family protein [Methanobacterium formicicum DSM 3637]